MVKKIDTNYITEIAEEMSMRIYLNMIYFYLKL